MRNLIYNINDVLDIINNAETYGYEDDVIFDFLIKGKNITQDEIENYCKDFLSDESKQKGYTIEDYIESKNRLISLIEKYS